MKCKITLTGRPSGAVKEVEGGIYEFLMKIDAAAPPMKGMKELGSSVYRVSVSKKVFDKIKDKIAPDTVLVMSGEQKASATKEGKPFILFNCHNLQVNKLKQKAILEMNEVNIINLYEKGVLNDDSTAEKVALELGNNYTKLWYKDLDNIVDIETSKIKVTDDIHIYSHNDKLHLHAVVDSRIVRGAIAVRPLGDGNFSLVAGASRLYQAKILDIETVPCFITNLDRDTFVEKYMIPLGIMSKKDYSSKEAKARFYAKEGTFKDRKYSKKR